MTVLNVCKIILIKYKSKNMYFELIIWLKFSLLFKNFNFCFKLIKHILMS